jgi:uncharacterized protein YbaP (TraB family)
MLTPHFKRIAWSLLFTLLFASWQRVGEATAQEKAFLWKVHSAKSTVYILGSIHFLKKDSYPLTKVIEDAFDNTKKLVLEIDLESATPEKAQRLTLEMGIYQDGTTLQQAVSEQTYVLAEQRAKELGVDLRSMNSLKPWVVALTMMSLKLQKLGFDPKLGVDRYLADRAKSRGEVTSGLETLEFQIGLMAQLSPQDQESMLREVLKEMDLLEKSTDEIVQAWRTGNLAAMQELMLAGMREYPDVQEKLLVARNRRWVPLIETIIQKGESALVVVGAAHLVGKDGVIELLKARGYTLEQLP